MSKSSIKNDGLLETPPKIEQVRDPEEVWGRETMKFWANQAETLEYK